MIDQVTFEPAVMQAVDAVGNPVASPIGFAPVDVVAEDEERQQREQREWFSSNLDNLHKAVLEPDAYFAGKDLSFARTAKDGQRQAVSDAYLALMNGGEAPGGGELGRKLWRDEVARRRFDGRGEGDDAAFYGEILNEAQGAKSHRELAQDLTTMAGAAAVSATVEAGAGKADAVSWEKWLQEARKKPGYDASNEADYLEAWNSTRAAIKESLAPIGGTLEEAWQKLRGGDLDLPSVYGQLEPEQREKFLASLAVLARTMPNEEQATFWGNFTKSAERAGMGLYLDLIGGRLPKGIPGFDGADQDKADAEAYERQSLGYDAGPTRDERRIAMRNFEADILKIRDATYDPIKVLNPDSKLLRVGEKAAYALPQTAGFFAVAALPGVGTPASFMATESFLYRSMRDSAKQAGASDENATRFAYEAAPVVALPYAALEKLGVEAAVGKLPMFNKLLEGINNRVTNLALRFAMRTAATSTAETLVENTQDLLPALTQEAASALSRDVPGVVWKNGKDGFLDGYWENTAVTWAAMLPLSVFAGLGGVQRDARDAAISKASDVQLQALFGSKKAVANIREAQAKGPGSLGEAIDRELETRNPNSEEAKEAVGQMEAAAKVQQQAMEKVEASGVFPRMVRTDKGWTLYDQESGEEIGRAADEAGALRLAAAHMDLREEDHADEVAYLSTLLEAGEATRKGDKAGEATAVDLRPGEAMSAERMMQRSKEDEARILAQIEAARARGEDVDLAAAVLGENLTELRRGVREMTNRLYAGGSVLTVFHEDAHKRLRLAQAKGLLQRDDLIRLGRALDTVLAGKESKHGHKLRLLPENEAEITDQALDEMVAELLESEIIRRRKTGGAYGLPAAVLSKNLGALTRLQAGVVKSFKQFVEAFRAFFGLAVSRAYEIKKGIKAGTIQEADLDEFMARLAGTSEQEEHDAASLAHADEILGGGSFEGDPFSLQGSKVAEALRTDAFSRIKDPVRRVRAMGKIARAMDEARLQFERIELLAREKGGKRVAKSLRREAAMREAMRREELENEAWARHMAVLSDDDLTKLKAQPGHAFLADPKSPLKGRLMSKSRALKKHPELFANTTNANYDGSEQVSRTVFGGDLTPDLAAQQMFEQGLLKEPTPDALWELLESEGKHVAQMRQFLETAKEDLREARTVAKAETNAWLQEETKNQSDPEQPYSPKQEILRMLQLLDGILAALPAEIRGKLGGHTQLARLGTNKTRLEYLKGKLERADELLEGWLKEQYHAEFLELLNKAKPDKDEAGHKPKGKIGADVHEMFATLREFMRKPMREAEAEAVKQESLVASGDLSAEEENHKTLFANMLRLVGDWYSKSVPVKNPETGAISYKQEGGASAARREAAVIEGMRIFMGGYHAHQIEVLRKREARERDRHTMQGQTGKEGDRTEIEDRQEKDEGSRLGVVKSIGDNFRSFEQVLLRVFGLKSAEAQKLADWERHASNAKADAILHKMELLDGLFTDLGGSRLKGELLRANLAKRGAIKIKNWKGKVEKFSELQAVAATLMWRQEDGRRHMEGFKNENGQPVGKWHYRQEDVDQLEAGLSQEARLVRLHLMEQYEAEYERINAVYRQLNGVNLPRHKFYSPLAVVATLTGGSKVVDPFSGEAMSGSGISPGSLRNRSATAVARPNFKQDALQTFIAHARQMEHYIAYAPFASEFHALMTRDLRDAVEAGSGAEALGVLQQWSSYFAEGGTRDAQAFLGFNRLFGRVLSRFASMALIGRVSVLFMQSLQLGAGLSQMPTGAYLKRFAKLMSGQMGWGDALKSDFIQRRMRQMPASIQQVMDGLRAGKPTRLKYVVRKLGETIAGADALFTAGTYAMVFDYQKGVALSMGLKGQAATQFATEAAERITERVAQPVRPGQRSILEVTSMNPAMRLLWSFSSEARQKFAVAVLGHSDRNVGEKARAYAVTWLIGGVGAAILRAAMRDLRDGGDDDEVFDERNWNPLALGLASLTGPLQGAALVGEAFDMALSAGLDIRQPEGSVLTVPKEAVKAAKHVPEWLRGDREISEAVKDAEAIITLMGLGSESAAAGTSLVHIIRDALAIAGNLAEE